MPARPPPERGGDSPGREARTALPRRITPVAIVYAAAFAWVIGKAALFRGGVPPGIPPDELAHVSYVAHLGASGSLLPRYEEMRLLDAAGRPGALPNYLPHPSLYYAALRGIDRVAGGGEESASPDGLARRLRRASAPLFTAAAALFLWLGLRRTAPLSAHVAYAAAVSTVPTLAFVGAAVNNDVLAFLSGGIVLVGLARWLEGRAGALTGTLLGAGVALALLAKATAGLLVSLALLGALFVVRRRAPTLVNRRLVFAFLPWLLLPALHFAPVLLRYGTPVPTLDVVDPGAFARSAFVEAPDAPALSVPEWGSRIATLFASTWLSLAGHVRLPVGPAWSLVGPLLLLGLAAIGLLAPGRAETDEDRASRALVRIGAVAVAATLLVNLAYSYAVYTGTRRVGGIHARYYLPLLPCFGLAAAAACRRFASGPLLAALLAALLALSDVSVTARYLALFPGRETTAAGGPNGGRLGP